MTRVMRVSNARLEELREHYLSLAAQPERKERGYSDAEHAAIVQELLDARVAIDGHYTVAFKHHWKHPSNYPGIEVQDASPASSRKEEGTVGVVPSNGVNLTPDEERAIRPVCEAMMLADSTHKIDVVLTREDMWRTYEHSARAAIIAFRNLFLKGTLDGRI